MWAFLGSECLFFGSLISTYLLYRDRTRRRAARRTKIFDIPFTSVSSFVLLMSVADDGAGPGGDPAGRRSRRLRIWLLATALLGHDFLGGQVYEFTTFYHEGLTLDDQPVRLEPSSC